MQDLWKTYHVCKCKWQNNDLYHHNLHTSCCFSSADVSLFHMVTRYYCIFRSLPCRANYYRKLYSKYITTGHQFFVPPRAETHSRLVSHLLLSLCHTCENLFHFHTIAALFPVWLHSDSVFTVVLGTPTGNKKWLFFNEVIHYLIYFAFLLVLSPFFELQSIICVKDRAPPRLWASSSVKKNPKKTTEV